MLELRHVDHVFLLGYADARAEVTNRFRRVAATSEAGDRRHARIVPSFDEMLLHELQQLPLAHDGVIQVQARKLDLLRPLIGVRRDEVADQPIVEWPMVLELQCAQRVRDAFERVGQRVREVVHWIDAPRIAGPVMGRVPDPVQRWISHVQIGRRHVDLRAEHVLAVGELAGFHPREQIQVFLD